MAWVGQNQELVALSAAEIYVALSNHQARVCDAMEVAKAESLKGLGTHIPHQLCHLGPDTSPL